MPQGQGPLPRHGLGPDAALTIDEAFLEQLQARQATSRTPASARCSAPAWTRASPTPSPPTATKTSTSASRSASRTTRSSTAPCRCRSGRRRPTTPTAPAAAALRGRQVQRVDDLRPQGVVPVPRAVGPRAGHLHDHEEVSTLPRLLPKKFGDKGLRYVDFKMGMPDEGIDADEAFVATGMAEQGARDAQGRQQGAADRRLRRHPAAQPAGRRARQAGARRQDPRRGVVVVDCIGEIGGKPATINHTIVPPDIKYVNERIPGGTMVSYGTSTPASIYAEMIVEGQDLRTRRRGPRDPRAQRARRLHQGARRARHAGLAQGQRAGQLDSRVDIRRERAAEQPSASRLRSGAGVAVKGRAQPRPRFAPSRTIVRCVVRAAVRLSHPTGGGRGPRPTLLERARSAAPRASRRAQVHPQGAGHVLGVDEETHERQAALGEQRGTASSSRREAQARAHATVCAPRGPRRTISSPRGSTQT